MVSMVSGGDRGLAGDGGPVAEQVLEARVRAMLLAAACGDLVGMPAAGLTPSQIRARYGRITGPVVPASDALHAGLAPGEVTDDTELLLALGEAICAAIEERGAFGASDVAEAVVGWARDRLDDPRLGPSTARAVRLLLAGAPPEEAGREGDTDGAAARIAPVAALHPGEPAGVDDDVVRACLPTHGTHLAIAAAGAVAAAEAARLGGADIETAVDHARRAAERLANRGREVPGPSVAARIGLAAELAAGAEDADVAARACSEVIGAGVRAVEAVPTALGIALGARGDPLAAILAAANVGDDADTVAAIAGAICAAGSGPEVLPNWVAPELAERLGLLAARLVRAARR